jgi:uncharacterized membrane protein
MQNIAIILALLLVPYLALIPVRVAESLRAHIGIFLVFVCTSIGHFVKTVAMSRMLPPWIPMRVPLIYVTGVFELLAGIAILVPHFSRPVGVLLCLFLVAILPSNIYAAFQRVDFGGHGMGPTYLFVRIPLQLFLIGWVYWFTVRA